MRGTPCRKGGGLKFQTRNEVIDEVCCPQHSEARTGRFICLAVSDTGLGMDEEIKARLFEPFFTTKGPGRGTGLGLAVVYGIVQAHEGWIAVESRPGQGSRFEIYLPVLELETEIADTGERPISLNHYRGRGERVLLVEDEPMLRAVTGQALTENGYLVRACGTVAEATEALRRGEDRFDLILSDVVLPDGRGTDLVFQILSEQPELAALLMTGYADERADRDRVREAGLTLLQKPFETIDLLKHIHEALKGDTL